MKQRFVLSALGMLGAIAMVGVTSPAIASEAATTTSVTVNVPMEAHGYDAAVAEAHGYKIVTSADGTETSVPVTAEAKAQVAKELAATRPRVGAGTVTPLTTVTGDCGSAALTFTKVKSKGGININTAYTLRGGKTSIAQHWSVSGQSDLGAPFDESFNGLNNNTSYWHATHFKSLYGYGKGGIGAIDSGSFAQFPNGLACFAASGIIADW